MKKLLIIGLLIALSNTTRLGSSFRPPRKPAPPPKVEAAPETDEEFSDSMTSIKESEHELKRSLGTPALTRQVVEGDFEAAPSSLAQQAIDKHEQDESMSSLKEAEQELGQKMAAPVPAKHRK